MRMYAFCAKCGGALSGATGFCPPCGRQQKTQPKRYRETKRSRRAA